MGLDNLITDIIGLAKKNDMPYLRTEKRIKSEGYEIEIVFHIFKKQKVDEAKAMAKDGLIPMTIDKS